MRKVLVVDDNPLVADAISDLLNGKAHVELATTVDEAMEMISGGKGNGSIDYVIIDGLDGKWEKLAAYVKQQAPLSGIGILSGDADAVDKARSLGYNAVNKNVGFTKSLKQLGLI